MLMFALFSSSLYADELWMWGEDMYYHDTVDNVLYYVGPIPSNPTAAPISGGGTSVLPNGGEIPPVPVKTLTPTGVIPEPPEINTSTYWNWYWYWFAWLVDENEPAWIPLEPHEFIPVGFDVMPF